MKTQTQTKPITNMLHSELEDLSNGVDDNEKELRIYSHGVLVMTVRVFKNFVDVENELTKETYNVLEMSESGIMYNGVPKLDM